MNNYDLADYSTIIFSRVSEEGMTLIGSTIGDEIILLTDINGNNPADLVSGSSYVISFNAIRTGDEYGFIANGAVCRDQDSRIVDRLNGTIFSVEINDDSDLIENSLGV